MLVLWVDGAGTGGRSFNWEMYLEVIRKYQPEILIFQQGPANIRWCGNEDGIAPDPCWYEIDTSHPIFNDDNRRLLGDGKVYLPVECDVSIRAGWFWSAHLGHTLKSVDTLVDIYHKSVGRGANLLLNITPDKSGKLPIVDKRRVYQFANRLKELLGSPKGSISGKGNEIILDLQKPTLVERIVIGEDLRFGQRVRWWVVSVGESDSWVVAGEGSSIGNKRIITLSRPSIAREVKLDILSSRAEAVIKDLSVY